MQTSLDTTSWPANLYQNFSDTIIAPICNLHQRVEEKILQYLTREQLELIYCILKAIPIALAISFLPPLVVLGAFIGILIIDEFKPDLFSKKTWTVISLACGFSGIINAGMALATAIKTVSLWHYVFFGLELLGSCLAFIRASATFEDYMHGGSSVKV